MKIKGINLNLNTVISIAAIIFVLLYFQQCSTVSNLKEDIKIANHNTSALLDSVTYYKTENGDLVFEKSTLIASKKELEDLNKDLYDEVDDLKKNPKIVIRNTGNIKSDPITIETEVIKHSNGEYDLTWKHDTIFDVNNYHKISGFTRFYLDSTGISNPITTIKNNEIGISITTGLTEKKGQYEIFVTSDYPGFTVTNIEGAIIDKKMITGTDDSFVVGPSIGYGAMFTSGGTVNHGWFGGINLTYNINKQIKKIFKPLR